MSMRSWLFVPGDRERRLVKATGSGADAVIIDLEDAVSPARKDVARRMAANFLAVDREAGASALWLRVNPFSSGLLMDDLAAVMQAAPTGIVLPKHDSVDDVWALHEELTRLELAHGLNAGETGMLAIATETARAIGALPGYTTAPDRLRAMSWGAEDLSAELGAADSREPGGELIFTYRVVRSLAQIAAAAAGVPMIETVYPGIHDSAGLMRIANRARREGFSGMLAIHPTQVPIINSAFAPSRSEIDRARRIVAAFESKPGAGAIRFDGQMLDRPHLRRAQRTLGMLE